MLAAWARRSWQAEAGAAAAVAGRRLLATAKPIFVCSNCKKTSLQFKGMCPACGEYNSFKEHLAPAPASASAKAIDREKQRWVPAASSTPSSTAGSRSEPANYFSALEVASSTEPDRLKFDDPELTRVFGGGLVMGSVVLLSGSPGIGKSTLALQLADLVSQKLPEGKKLLYVSGEESVQQIGMRTKRLRGSGAEVKLQFDRVDIFNESNLTKVMEMFYPGCEHAALVIDSVQAVFMQDSESDAGGVNQIRACATAAVRLAKASKIPVILIGHITKSGDIAGPQLLSHIVDVVLFFDGDPIGPHRWLSATKNRFGANEVGVFEMTDAGFVPLAEGSKTFVSESGLSMPAGVTWAVSGSSGQNASSSTPHQGSRFLLSEVQILTNPIPTGEGGQRARRVKASGISLDRVEWLSAVLVKHVRGMEILDRSDIFINVVGGLHLNDRGCDLSLALALASARFGRELKWPQIGSRSGVGFVGEIGLAGDVRMPRALGSRINAANKAGLARIIVPQRWEDELKGHAGFQGLEIVGVGSLTEVVDLCLVNPKTVVE
ncbi:DNA repair protein RadA [Batrachochytrium salamandrivorans]|nr:DNA repair protein RadA [Batrachochytrium salamandrivorans]